MTVIEIKENFHLMLISFLPILVCSLILCSLNINISSGFVNAINLDNTKINFSNIYNLSNNKNDSVYGQIFSFNRSSVYLVWQDSVISNFNNPYPTNYDIFFKIIDSTNKNQSNIINISNNSGFSEHPQLSASGNNVYLTWIDNTNGNKQVLYRFSNNGGISFSTILQLNHDLQESSNVEISSFDNYVHIIWQQKNLNDSSIVLRSSNDYGKTFDREKIISNYSSNSYPKVYANGGNVYVSYNIDDKIMDETVNFTSINKNEIFFSKSNDAGNNFLPPVRLNSGQNFNSGESQIHSTANANHVYVIWTQKDSSYDSSTLYVANSTYKGDSFRIDQIKLDNSQITNPSNADVNSYGNNLVIAFQAKMVNSSSNDNEEIYFMLLDYKNNSASQIYDVSDNMGFSECPSISLNTVNKVLSISWEDRTLGNNEILYRELYY